MKTDVEVRFWGKVNKTETCWLWTGAVDKDGYGLFQRHHHDQVRAHRLSYSEYVGPIPPRFVVDHSCRTPSCVRPGHLRAVTPKQNRENTKGPARHNKTGFLGVDLHDGKYRARVMHNGMRVEIGSFNTAEEAGEAARIGRLSMFSHNDVDREAGRGPVPARSGGLSR